jgi:hypothetical protein
MRTWKIATVVASLVVLLSFAIAAFASPDILDEREIDLRFQLANSGQREVVITKNLSSTHDVYPLFVVTTTSAIALDIRVATPTVPYPNVPDLGVCKVYVPDNMWRNEFNPTFYFKFSSVTDWNTMLGANANDAWPQTVCRSFSGFGAFEGAYEGIYFRAYMAWMLSPMQPTPTAVPTIAPITVTTGITVFLPVVFRQIDPLTDVDQEVSLIGSLGNKVVEGGFGVDQKLAIHVSGNDGYALRISVGGQLQLYNSQEEIVACEVYVPDVLIGQYPMAKKFSLVEDWSFENMLGAAATDTVPQTICRKPIAFIVSDQSSVFFFWHLPVCTAETCGR